VGRRTTDQGGTRSGMNLGGTQRRSRSGSAGLPRTLETNCHKKFGREGGVRGWTIGAIGWMSWSR
jgi:hypothetical protein